LCRDCRRKARQAAAQRPCPRCGRPGYLREATGWCGPCSWVRQPKDPPRQCAQCGQVKRHEALGLCSPCWQRCPERPFVRASHPAAWLADPPGWLDGFAAYLATGNGPSRACMLRCTRLADLVNTMDPKLVAAAFGMNSEGVMIYLADHVDTGRLAACPDAKPVREQ
jgi:hypothetical protein